MSRHGTPSEAMNIREISELMSTYEAANETVFPKRNWIVVRLDGRGFTKLTKTGDAFEKPFDERFKEGMVITADALMNCGFDMPLAYTQSDEISVVISPNCSAFGRRSQKLTTVLSGQASATMSLFLERPCVFDARALLLPTSETVGHYLQWRQQDAHRLSLIHI